MNAIVLATALAVTGSDSLLFDGGEQGWLVMSRSGERARTVHALAGMKPTEAAISPDGRTWGFIAEARLFLWQESWRKPVEVARSGDVLKHPSFSADGRWLYFIQNDAASMQGDEPMRYSQVWRVSSKGGVAEKLTRSVGCHSAPAALPNGTMIVTHATCRVGRGIALVLPALRAS